MSELGDMCNLQPAESQEMIIKVRGLQRTSFALAD